MTGTELAALIRYKTRTNSTTFTDADILPLVNAFKDEFASKIVERNNGMFLIPATFNLVADQREYGLGDDTLNRIHKLEIKFASGDSRFPSQNIKDYHGSETESEIVKSYANSEGEFAHTIRRRALFILSGTIIAVTGGGRLWAHIFPADLANLTGSSDLGIDPSTTSFGIPRQFHELLARRVAMEYKMSQPKPVPLNVSEQKFDIDMKIQLDAISHIDNSAEIIGNELPDQDTGNDGWNY
ncbi:hypothetical protein KAJ89_03315 [Candidatus Parcubacteria bacterium]|nr:hypothetical protein [Candidatus Parcubacteria bacterium]